MKKIIFFISAIFTIISFTACKDKKNGLNDKPVTLVMAESNPDDSISAWIDKAFAEKASELSHGTITINLHTGGILGDNTSVMKVMTQPKPEIHLARISPAALVTYGCDKHELLDIPYTFVNRAHFWNFALSDTAQVILNEPYEKNIGVKGLFFAEEGFRHFFSTSELKGVADFKGEKIRNAGNSIMKGIIQSLHGEPVSISFSELYSSLQTGIVDIAEQPIANYLSNHFNKIAPYMILDGHQLGVTEVVISADAWKSLTEYQQKALIEAGKYAGEYCKKVAEEAENKSRLTLKSEGTHFVEVMDKSEWQKACADIIATSSQAYPELYKEITDFAK